jgi:predicted AAA+ superfamily ATPase
MSQERRIEKKVKKDLNKKMVFVAGPRQCGKTTLAKKILKEYDGVYYNWDKDEHKKLIRNNNLDHSKELWVFDELHKFKNWRNWLKGNFDLYNEEKLFLVTGSAKLDYYSRGGDSLQGRYFLHRLHPFTLSELCKKNLFDNYEKLPLLEIETKKDDKNSLLELMKFGGFPEPLFSASLSESKRWRASYGSRLIREDIKDLQLIKEVDKMELLYEHLPNTIGSVLSINSLREDLEVNHQSVKNWIEIFEKNYACFRIPPFGANKLKAVKKEQKLYFWDWAVAQEESKKLENLVAVHLLRFCHWIYDNEGEKLELRYFRDTVGHEVDFIILKNKKPWIAIEVKLSDSSLDSSLSYLLKRVKIPYAFQIYLNGTKYQKLPEINGCKIQIIPAEKLLVNLP